MIKYFLSLLFFSILLFSNPTDAQIQGRLNIVNGYASECVMHKFHTDSGWKQIEGEVGRNGIDGSLLQKEEWCDQRSTCY